MDGVQNNFSKMAEKINRMRCLREQCDDYVKLIKLILDETIQEQNLLLNESAIHNRLKHLDVMYKPIATLKKFNTDKKYTKNINFDNKYKYLVFDDHFGNKYHSKKIGFNTNEMYLSNNYKNYGSSYRPKLYNFSSTTYDDLNKPYYMPINFKKYEKTMNFRTPYPQEYEVYYFPSSKPIAQYPRQTTERFYRRKPVEQYPEEEVPYWSTRYIKPVRVIQRDIPYSIVDYDYHSANNYHVDRKNIDPYLPEYRTRYIPNTNMYHSYDDRNNCYDLGQRSFSSKTRPCSPIFNRVNLYDRPHLENFGNLLEKKIRDYVWEPHKENVEKYAIPNYEKTSHYTTFKPLENKYQIDESFRTHLSLGSRPRVRKTQNEIIKENAFKRNSVITSPERKLLNNESFQLQKDDNRSSECISYKKKTEIPTHLPKRISFDLDDEDNEQPNQRTSIKENIYDIKKKEHKLDLETTESNTKFNDMHRNSLISNNDFPTSINKHVSLDKGRSSRRESVNKPDNLDSNENIKLKKYINLSNDSQKDSLNSYKENVNNYNNNNEKLEDYDLNKDIKVYPKIRDEKNNVTFKDIPNENVKRNIRRDSNDNNRRQLSMALEKLNIDNQNQGKNMSNKINDLNNNDKEKFKNIYISGSRRNSVKVDNQLDSKYNPHQSDILTHKSSETIVPSTNHDDIILNKNNNKNEPEIDHQQQFISNDKTSSDEIYAETSLPYHTSYLNNNSDVVNSDQQDNSELKTILKESENTEEILNDELTNVNYDQNHSNEDVQEHPSHEFETQPEYVTSNDDYYQNKHTEGHKESIITDNIVEPIQHNELADVNNTQGDYYYQNTTDEIKENTTENQYENPDLQENYVDQQHKNDDYYYQNYPNTESKDQPDNEYNTKADHQEEYVAEHTGHNDNYYYQDQTGVDIKDQTNDQQYVDPNYQGNYVDPQQTNDDYYYQNYDNTDPKEQVENQYSESVHPREYGTEQNEHDDYYYQNQPEENSSEGQNGKNYDEFEHRENYVNGKQENDYYEYNSNLNTEGLPTEHYNEHVQQESYVDDQNPINDGYYYQNRDGNYDESIPKEQYDGYTGDQHESNDSYYPDSQTNNYDPQNNYGNDNYQTQQSEYIESYEQNPNENYSYSDNIDENQSTNEISNEQSK